MRERERVAIRGSALGFVLPLAMASCSVLVDTTGLAGGANGSGGGGGSDAGGDAALDASSVDGAAGADPCADPAVVLCERFDTVTAISRYPKETDDSTSIGSDDALFFSSPRSAVFAITPGSNGSPDAALSATTSQTLSHFAVEGRVNIERGEPGEDGQLLDVKLGAHDLYLKASGIVSEDSATRTTFAPIARGRWVLVRLEVDVTGGAVAASVSVDGAPARALALSGAYSANTVSVKLGISEAFSPTAGWRVHWDDVIVRRL